MKKTIALLLVVAGLSFGGNVRNVFYHCKDYTGAEFDFSAAPYDNVVFKAWITTRPTELLQEFSAGSGWFMLGGAYSAVFVQIGNFASPWAAGDQVTFLVRVVDLPGDVNAVNLYEGTQTTAALDGLAADVYGGFDAEGFGGGPVLSVSTTPSSINEMVPVETKLHQNYPNPFNPTTTIKFDLNSDSVVKLNVYNYNGQLVKSLVDGSMKAGIHTVEFDASNLCAGVYYYTMEAGNSMLSNKMVLVK